MGHQARDDLPTQRQTYVLACDEFEIHVICFSFPLWRGSVEQGGQGSLTGEPLD